MGYERHLSTARQQALDLSKRKDAIETEMDVIFESLHQNNGPGLQGNLLDREGFPRSDIDVLLIRQQRNRFASLKTDHKAVAADLDKLMHIALAPTTPPTISGAASSTGTAAPLAAATATTIAPTPTAPAAPSVPSTLTPPTDGSAATSNVTAPQQQQQVQRPTAPPVDTRQPFALVDMVSPSSPSATAGLQVDDRVIAFGAVSLRSSPTPSDALSALPGLLRSHEDCTVDVIIRRGEASDARTITFTLTPRKWEGQGLLGCHVVPLEVSQVDAHYAPEVATAVMLRANTLPGQP